MSDDPPSDGPPATMIVLAAHGSRSEAGNRSHVDLARRLAEATGSTVLPAFLELTEPSIPDAIDEGVGRGSVVVLPYFLHPGRHLLEDVPAIVVAARERHPDASIRLLDAFGAGPGIIDLLAAQVATDTDTAV